MKIRIVSLLALFIVLFACNHGRREIDSAISRLDTADLRVVKSLCIYYRSMGEHRNSSIYFLSVYDDKCSPYIVEVDNDEKKILGIRNDLVIKSCGKETVRSEDITMAMKKYFELHVCLICVDRQGNVYVNPTEQKRPTVLRKANGAQPKDFAEFSHYKKDWYVRNGSLD